MKIEIKSVDVCIIQFDKHFIMEQLGIVDLYYYKNMKNSLKVFKKINEIFWGNKNESI